MKLLFVTSSFAGGGITTYAHEFIKCFSNSYDISVIIGNDDQNPLDNYKIKIYKYDVDNDLSVTNAQNLIKFINDIIKPNIIVNSNAVLMTLISPYIHNAIRIISVSHSLRYNEADIAGYNTNYIDQIIALSQYNKNYLCTRYRIKQKEKVSIVYNFVNNIIESEEIIKYKKINNTLRIVYSGGTSAAKSPELIFKIIKELVKIDKKFEFYFIGVTSPTLKKIQGFKSIVDLLPTDNRIKFTGRLPHKDAVSLISSANIYLIPSRREGCPMAMLEAMRGGAIIITSDYKNACREMIEDGKNGYIIGHNNVKECVNRINDILSNHKKYYKMYDLCYDNYVQNYSADNWKNQMNKLLISNSYLHGDRINNFSIKKYKKDRLLLKSQFLYNNYHMILFETLKSALFFKVEYIKNKLNIKK